MSVATFVEISIVIEARHRAEGLRDLDHFLGRAGFELVPVDAGQGTLARGAFSRFGKGRHRAGLNYGDCFSYALAISTGEPLLFKRTTSCTSTSPSWIWADEISPAARYRESDGYHGPGLAETGGPSAADRSIRQGHF